MLRDVLHRALIALVIFFLLPLRVLAQEKIVGVDTEFGRYSIVCTVLDEEGNTEALAEERLRECLQLLLGVRPEKQTVHSPLDFFSNPTGGPSFFEPSNSPGEGTEGTQSPGKPLF